MTAWCFFALIWTSAYTANLAATLTNKGVAPAVESLADLVRDRAIICSQKGAAYTDHLSVSYKYLTIKTYSSLISQVQALEDGECVAVINEYANINAIANGVVDLDSTSGYNYCDLEKRLVIAGTPEKTGFTDMAVGVSYQYPTLRSVLSYWITEMRTCVTVDSDSECYQGTGNGVNLEVLRQQHVEKANCGDSHLAINGPRVLSISNFLFPIAAVALAGITFICWVAYKHYSKRHNFLLYDSIDTVLTDPIFTACFVEIGNGRRVLMMDLLGLVLESEGDAYRVLLVKAAGKYFLFNDMKSFFVLTRLANKLYPGYIDGEVISSKIKHMQSAGAASFEVEHGVNMLICRALKWHFRHSGSNDRYTFVCRDQLQFDLLKKNNFGEMSDDMLKAIETTRDSKTVAKERTRRSENLYESVVTGRVV